MTLEATLLCLDNSEWSRNGDYVPNRMQAQQDCAHMICDRKMQVNRENAVGLLTMASERIDVRVAPTDDFGKIPQGMRGIPVDGSCDFIRGIQTAQLALKHRMNKNQRQRIILFVCSPIMATEKQLEQVGRMLKKNSVSLDIVSFGNTETNSEKLQKLLQAVNSSDTSHLVEIPPGSGLLVEQVRASVIVGGGSADAAGGEDDDFLATNDPEMLMAIRLSLQEEQNRLQRAAGGGGEDAPAGEQPSSSSAAPPAAPVAPPAVEAPTATEAAQATSADGPGMPTVQEIEAMDVDDDLRRALLLSVQDHESAAPPTATTDATMADAQTSTVQAADVGRLPGVDVSDPRIQEALREANEKRTNDANQQGSSEKKE